MKAARWGRVVVVLVVVEVEPGEGGGERTGCFEMNAA